MLFRSHGVVDFIEQDAEEARQKLGRPLLASQAFAIAAGRSRDHLVSLGRHRLRGVREETELFTLAG